MATPKYDIHLVLKNADDPDPSQWEWKFKFPFYDVHFPSFRIDFYQSVAWQIAINLPYSPDTIHLDLSHIRAMCQLVCDCDSIEIVFPNGTYEHVSREFVGDIIDLVSNFERIYCNATVDDFVVQTNKEIIPRTSVKLSLG